MAIKSNSGEKITATDINALIDKIQEKYQDRPVTTTGTDRNGANASINLNDLSESLNDVNKNETIGFNLYKIVNTILVMNDVPNLLVNGQYDIIISDGIANNADLKDSLPTTCRGACMGTCTSGCSGGTKSNSSGTSGHEGDPIYTIGNDGDAVSCNGQCSGCTGSCGSCTGRCGGQCYGQCSTGCYQSCTGTCHGCNATCSGECKGGCGNSCKNNCDANCKNECALNCTGGCYGSVKNNTYT